MSIRNFSLAKRNYSIMIIHYDKRVFMQSKKWQERLANYLQSLKEERGLSEPQLARRAGVSTTTIWNILNQENDNPGLMTLIKVAKGLRMSPVRFFVGLLDENEDLTSLPGFASSEFGWLYEQYSLLNEEDRQVISRLINVWIVPTLSKLPKVDTENSKSDSSFNDKDEIAPERKRRQA